MVYKGAVYMSFCGVMQLEKKEKLSRHRYGMWGDSHVLQLLQPGIHPCPATAAQPSAQVPGASA